jgi:CRISPR/Cas system CSM-associated protein Csm5 (group 7 of RAMP superfamily)
MILQTQRKVDFDKVDITGNLDEHDTEQGAFEDFVEQAREILPIEEQHVDVFIGYGGGDMGTFLIPHKFFELIAETKWPVTFSCD